MEAAVSDLGPQLVEKHLDSLPGFDGAGGLPIHSGRAGTLVSPDTVPRHQQEGGIGHEVEQVVEPAMRIIGSPTVQLGLDLQYPAFGLHQGPFQLVDIHRRQPPGIPVSLLPTCWPPSPCDRLSRPRSTTEPPSCPTAISRRWACPRSDWMSDIGATADSSHVHHEIDRQVRCPALPRQHRHAYAADFQRGLPTDE